MGVDNTEVRVQASELKLSRWVILSLSAETRQHNNYKTVHDLMQMLN